MNPRIVFLQLPRLDPDISMPGENVMLAAIEAEAERRIGGFDSPTRCFVGTRLPDLFPERVRGLEAWGSSNRRAAIFSGADLFARREAITGWMKEAVRREPDILWQFVFEPQDQEPLDLLFAAIAAVDGLLASVFH
ncbi:MAG: hypothetical protein NTY77_15965 [Elusimicrobia bacterium]|nr:hypothetical protein [Elusimicrobiota bacterium]